MPVSRLLGHHSPAFTLAVYSHLMDIGTGGPLELDQTPSMGEFGMTIEHALREEKRPA